MRFKRLMTGALALAATGLLVTACSSKQKANSTGQVAPKQVLDWSYLAELATLDPSKVSDAYSGDIINNSMEGLYRLGKNSKIEPGLATQTEVSDDIAASFAMMGRFPLSRLPPAPTTVITFPLPSSTP